MENIKWTFEISEPEMYKDIAIEKVINTLKHTNKWNSLRKDKIVNFCLSTNPSPNDETYLRYYKRTWKMLDWFTFGGT